MGKLFLKLWVLIVLTSVLSYKIQDTVFEYVGPGDEDERKTTIVGFDAKIEQPLGKIFAVSLGYNLIADPRSFLVVYKQENNDGERQVDDLSYVRHLVTLLMAVRI